LVGLLRALDSIGGDDVYVVSSGGGPDVSLWGELLSRSQSRAARSAPSATATFETPL
jgi:hypothetical protein